MRYQLRHATNYYYANTAKETAENSLLSANNGQQNASVNLVTETKTTDEFQDYKNLVEIPFSFY